MKILCFSDSHGSDYYIKKALVAHPDAEAVFFLGDGIADVMDFIQNDRGRAWLPVRGNCDALRCVGNTEIKETEMITLEGKKILYTHGHLYDVKYGTSVIAAAAERAGADIALFGHTHMPYEAYIPIDTGGIYLFNPGSIGRGYSYGIITLSDGSVLFSHAAFV